MSSQPPEQRSSSDHETQDLFQQQTSEFHDNRTHKKKISVMSQSGQTPTQRKALRKQLRRMHNDILSGAAGLPPDNGCGKSAFDSMRGRNNKLWDQVHYTSEAALESKNLELIAHHAARAAESLVTLPRYDADRLAKMLRQNACVRASRGDKYFAWKEFGNQAGICFNSLPTHVNFLYGPLDYDDYVVKKKKRAARTPRVQEEDVKEERPIEADQRHRKKGTGNELSAIERHMKTTYHILIAKSKASLEDAKSREGEYVALLKRDLQHLGVDERNTVIAEKTRRYMSEAQKVDAVQALFDPHSFTQTVENINHLSFFIRANSAAVDVRSADEATEFGLGGPGPVIRPLMKRQEEPLPPRQAVLSLNMRDWRDMCKAFEVERSDVPHRGQPLQSLSTGRDMTNDTKPDACAVPQRNSSIPTCGMPKTAGLDDDTTNARSKSKVVTPSKHEGKATAKSNPACDDDNSPLFEDNTGRELRNNFETSNKQSKARRHLSYAKRLQFTNKIEVERKRPVPCESSPQCAPSSSRCRTKSKKIKKSEQRLQPDPDDVVDLTQTSGSGGVIYLTDD